MAMKEGRKKRCVSLEFILLELIELLGLQINVFHQIGKVFGHDFIKYPFYHFLLFFWDSYSVGMLDGGLSSL